MLEAARRTEEGVDIVVVDVFEVGPVTLEVFRTLALRVVDALLSAELGASTEQAAHDPGDLRRLLDRSSSFAALPAQLKTELRELAESPPRAQTVRRLLQLEESVRISSHAADGLATAITASVVDHVESRRVG